MRVVYMAKCKRSAAESLEWLVAEGFDVAAVLAAEPDELTQDSQRVDLVAERHGLPLVSEEQLYEAPPAGVDLVISFLYWRRIREPLLSLGRMGCLNFHPAPLPDMRGVGGYNVAILEGMAEWGVSCHFVDPALDTGDIVEVERFPIDPDAATAFSLDLESQERLSALFRRVLARDELPRTPQGEGRYITREQLEALRVVRPGDDLDRKLRAFWYPPHPGAVIEVGDRMLTLVDERLLADAARAYRGAGQVP